MTEGKSMVSRIDAEIAKLQELRAFALKFDKEVGADTEEVAETKATPKVTVGVKKKAAAKSHGKDAASIRTAILTFLEEQGEPVAAETIAPHAGVSGGELTAHLRDLAEAKEIKRTGQGRGTRWSSK